MAGDANGTRIQALDLSAEEFGGPEYEGCNEYLNVLRPQLVQDIHRSYLKAGVDIVITNSFGSTPLVLDEYGLGHRAKEISEAAARNARQAADEFSTPNHPRLVAGSMGPTTRSISVTGGVTWDELREHYLVQASGLWEGGADLLLVGDFPGHAERQGCAGRHRRSLRQAGGGNSRCRPVHHRNNGDHPGRAGRRGFLLLRGPSQSAVGGDELLDGTGIHGGPPFVHWLPSPGFRCR